MEYTTSQTVARFKDIQQTLASQNREKIVAMHFHERADGTYIFVKPGKSATLGAARTQPQEAENQAKCEIAWNNDPLTGVFRFQF
jgi:hypothetical protein